MTALHELPVGYTSLVTPSVDSEQVQVLHYPDFAREREASFMVGKYASLDADYALDSVKSIYLGIRSEDGSAVGVGCLRYSAAEGELCNLAVLPEHRSRGIGKWLIAERVRMARALNLRAVYVGQVATTNTLKFYYHRIGFKEHNDRANVPILTLGEQLKDTPHLSYTV